MIIIIKSFLFCFKKKRGLLPYPLLLRTKTTVFKKKTFFRSDFPYKFEEFNRDRVFFESENSTINKILGSMRYMDNKEPKSAQFFRYYNGAQKRLYAYLLMMVHNHSDAEDLLQETASALWEQYEQFDPGRNFTAWAIGIARNKAIDFLRQKRTTRPMFSDSFYEKMSTLAEEESQNVDRRLLALRTCIKQLSADNQRLLRLRFEEGISIKKLSQNSPYSPQALYKKISRIYSSLYNCIHRILLHGEQA